MCRRCGAEGHTMYSKHCPAWGVTCDKCRGKYHYAKMCRTKNVAEVEINDSDSEDDVCLDSMDTPSKSGNTWFAKVQVAGTKIKMKVDTGAQTNTMPAQLWNNIDNRPALRTSKTKLKALGNTIIPHEGVAVVPVRLGSKTIEAKMYVTSDNTVPIFGLKASEQLGLVKPGKMISIDAISEKRSAISMETLKSGYKDVFNGLGKYQSQYHIELKENAIPVIQPPRRVPPKLYQPLRNKIEQMLKLGVIKPVEKPTDWVNGLVITEKKDGSLRLCLDPKNLNTNIKRETFEIPTFQDIVTCLGGKKLFTIMDQKDAYWQIPLDDESADLCTFSTPFGRFKFLRMPFGISSASEVQQKKTFQVFGDINGVFVVADDMLIAAENEEEHDKILTEVLEHVRKENVKFNLKKVQLKKTEVKYMGVRLGKDGLKPDEVKVKAILEMPDPTDRAGVLRLMGMLNFLSPFIPNKSSITAPLRNLLKSDVAWHWEYEQKEAMRKVKEILTSDTTLKLFEADKPITIQADASSTGLGACLMQNDQPVAYASRSLTDCETKYAQIEKELLAIVFAVEKFHQYIYGSEVIVQSDHKPLENIFKKLIYKSVPRIQLMRMRLMRYNLSVGYKKGIAYVYR